MCLYYYFIFALYLIHLDECTSIQRKCGEIQTYNIDNRTSTIYIPSFVCNKQSYLKFFSINQNPHYETQPLLPIPIVVALHGLGNDIYRFLNEYTKLNTYAEQYGFIVIAPVALYKDKSWNGIYCCGDGVAKNVDDLEFIKHVITSSVAKISTLFSDTMTVNITAENIQLFVTGMSNGAFMTDEIAWSYVLGEDFLPITAFGPYLGFMYDVKDVKAQMSHDHTGYLHKTVPIFFQHGDKDNIVKVTGCCHQQSCGGDLKIDSFKEDCTSLYEEYKKWLNWNHCRQDVTFESIAAVSQRKFDSTRQLKCATATPWQHNCDEVTKMCIFMGNQLELQGFKG